MYTVQVYTGGSYHPGHSRRDDRREEGWGGVGEMYWDERMSVQLSQCGVITVVLQSVDWLQVRLATRLPGITKSHHLYNVACCSLKPSCIMADSPDYLKLAFTPTFHHLLSFLILLRTKLG